MTTSQLFSKRLVCYTHKTEHGFNSLIISTHFQIDFLKVIIVLKRLHKNIDWKVLNVYIQEGLLSIKNINLITNLNDLTSRLTKIVLKDIKLSVLIAKASSYNKRWWMENLFLLGKS